MSRKKTVRTDPLEQKLPPGGVDSHAHLDDSAFDGDRAVVLARAHAAGLSRVGNIFLEPLEFEARKHVFDEHPEVFFVMGIHPCEGRQCTEEALAAMRRAFASEARLRALGEIGLDYHWRDCPRELQMKAFGEQLELARALEKPVVVHCREAEGDCLALLEARGFAGYPLLWHCFGGDARLAERLVRNGWHVSVPGPVTYPGNASLREALRHIPSDRLLLETDCPYLSPEPWRGMRNEPAYTVFTARAVAAELDIAPDILWKTCGDNAMRFFNLTE